MPIPAQQFTLTQEKFDRLMELLNDASHHNDDYKEIATDLYQQSTYNPSDEPTPYTPDKTYQRYIDTYKKLPKDRRF